jgi:hypothetical protein
MLIRDVSISEALAARELIETLREVRKYVRLYPSESYRLAYVVNMTCAQQIDQMIENLEWLIETDTETIDE